MSERVLVDTSVWIDYFRGDPQAVEQLHYAIDRCQVLVCGMIRQEVLQGSRNRQAFRRLQKEMSIWEYEAETPDDFVKAALLFAELRWQGVAIPPSDCLVAAVALRLKAPVLARDAHFDAIPGLARVR